jgi:hypothetical protein
MNTSGYDLQLRASVIITGSTTREPLITLTWKDWLQ